RRAPAPNRHGGWDPGASRRGRRSYGLPVPRECPGFLLRRLPRPPVGGAPPRRTGRVDGPAAFAAGAPLLRPARASRVLGVSPATPAPPSVGGAPPRRTGRFDGTAALRGGGAAPTAC